MELKSFTYLFFILVVFILYYLFSRIKHAQSIIILLASLTFIFFSGGVKILVLIAVLAAIVYGFGIWIEKKKQNKKDTAAKVLLIVGIILVIGTLCYFKFFKYTYTILQNALLNWNIVLSDLIAPIGISYYSLSMTAYLLDVAHKKHPAEKNFFKFLTFITFFPSIVEGPINLYKKVSPQLQAQHKYNSQNVIMGFQRAIWGFFKKAVIADRIGILVVNVIGGEYKGPIVLIAMILYSFQIYGDFSGGIDIIMGVSEMLDIKLTENFRAPLMSKSVSEYWNRWHISLGEFMEKYIYFPIVLSKKTRKISKKIRNKYLQKVFAATVASIIVFVLVGIWHGTGWNYVVYGCYQAFWVSTATLLAPFYKKVKSLLHINEKSISWNIFTVVRTFVILLFGRYLIRAADLHDALGLFKRTLSVSLVGITDLLNGDLGLDTPNMYLMVAGIILLIIVDICHNNGIRFREKLMKQDVVFRFAIYFIGIFSVLIFGIYGAEFDTSSFIYGGF